MISAWWLLLIIPASTFFGLMLGGVLSVGAAADGCAEYKYCCKMCPDEREESE